MELKDRLLSSVENHGKIRLDGLFKLYPTLIEINPAWAKQQGYSLSRLNKELK